MYMQPVTQVGLLTPRPTTSIFEEVLKFECDEPGDEERRVLFAFLLMNSRVSDEIIT